MPKLANVESLSHSLPQLIKPHPVKPVNALPKADQAFSVSTRPQEFIQEICKRGAASSRACISPMKMLMQEIAGQLSPEMLEKLDIELISHDPKHFYDTMVAHPELLQTILSVKNHAAAEMITQTLRNAGSRTGNMALFKTILDHENLVAFQIRVSHSDTERRLKIHHLGRDGPTSHVLTLDDLQKLVEHVNEFSDDALSQLWNYLKHNSDSLVSHSRVSGQDILEEHASTPMDLHRDVPRHKVLHFSDGGYVLFDLRGEEDPRLTGELVTKAYSHSLNEMTQNIIKKVFDETLKRDNTRALNEIIQTDNYFNRMFPRVSDLYRGMASNRQLASFMMKVENPAYIRNEWIPGVLSLASKEFGGNIELFKWMLNREHFVDWQNTHHPRQVYIIGFKDLKKIRYDLSKDAVREVMEYLLRNRQEIKYGRPRHEVIKVIDFWIRKSYQYLHFEAPKYIEINGLMTELLARAAFPFWN